MDKIIMVIRFLMMALLIVVAVKATKKLTAEQALPEAQHLKYDYSEFD